MLPLESRRDMKIYTFENRTIDIRAYSSAGGLFTALAEIVLNKGGVVYGASFDEDWSVVHRRIDNVADICHLRGSEYVFTDINGCFSQVCADLKDGRTVLFSGTPCQIAAVRKKFGYHENILLVEVVCHGAPKKEYWSLYLDELLKNQGKTQDEIASINFRDKTKGWKNYSVCVEFKGGSRFIQNHRDNLYIQAFVHDYTLREGCTKCPFKNPNSKADISMGDFWGIEALAPNIDNNLGTTIAIADTAKGESILDSIACRTYFSVEQVAQYNPAIVKSPSVPLDKPEFDTTVKAEGFHYAAAKFLKPVFDSRDRKMSFRNQLRSFIYRVYSFIKNR